MIPFGPDHPATRIRNLPRPGDHPGYRNVDPTLQVPGPGGPPVEPAEVRAVAQYASTRAAILADIAPDWTDDNDLLHCPDGYPVEDDGECPDGHVSPFRTAGLI